MDDVRNQTCITDGSGTHWATPDPRNVESGANRLRSRC